MSRCASGNFCEACSLPAHLLTQEPGCGGPVVTPALHFVGFRGAEYISAVRVWGKPGFIHRVWDRRAKRDLHPSDKVIFAKGTEHDEPNEEGFL